VKSQYRWILLNTWPVVLKGCTTHGHAACLLLSLPERHESFNLLNVKPMCYVLVLQRGNLLLYKLTQISEGNERRTKKADEND